MNYESKHFNETKIVDPVFSSEGMELESNKDTVAPFFPMLLLGSILALLSCTFCATFCGYLAEHNAAIVFSSVIGVLSFFLYKRVI